MLREQNGGERDILTLTFFYLGMPFIEFGFLARLTKNVWFDHTFSPDLFRCIYRLRLFFFFFSCKSQGYTNVSSTLGWYKKYLEGELGSLDCRTWLWARTPYQMETDKVVIFFLFNKKKKGKIFISDTFLYIFLSKRIVSLLFSTDICQNAAVFKWLTVPSSIGGIFARMLGFFK